MPNGGVHHCAGCEHHSPRHKRCKLRKVKIELDQWTTCRNRTVWHDRSRTLKEITGPLYSIVGYDGGYCDLPYFEGGRVDSMTTGKVSIIAFQDRGGERYACASHESYLEFAKQCSELVEGSAEYKAFKEQWRTRPGNARCLRSWMNTGDPPLKPSPFTWVTTEEILAIQERNKPPKSWAIMTDDHRQALRQWVDGTLDTRMNMYDVRKKLFPENAAKMIVSWLTENPSPDVMAILGKIFVQATDEYEYGKTGYAGSYTGLLRAQRQHIGRSLGGDDARAYLYTVMSPGKWEQAVELYKAREESGKARR